jgi:SAM-dependent methyltransferase
MSSNENGYDRVPYPSNAHSHTHPDRAAAIAILFGMVPSDVEHCRVLELGCGQGGNLIPMAYGLPGSEFLGLDLAAKPIEGAQAQGNSLGLKNIQFRQMDILDIGPELGKFDYIIAHGVYSWVPPAVQEKLLAICNQNLNANGIAFMSYNTTPGGHIRQILREMMWFHTRHVGDTEERAREGRAFLGQLLETMDARNPFRNLFQEEFNRLSRQSEYSIYHDEFSPNFWPIAFSDFVGHAARHEMQFLGEVELDAMVDVVPDPDPFAPIKQAAGRDPIAVQQYLDYVRFRWFRQTLLCRREIPLCRDRIGDRLGRLLIASRLRRSAELPEGVNEFRDSQGLGTIKTSNPSLIASLLRLEQIWPRAEPYDDLLSEVCTRIPGAVRSAIADDLSRALLTLAAGRLVDLRTLHLPIAACVSQRPEASLLARLEAKNGDFVTTLLHSHVKLEDEHARQFLQFLDGTRDRNQLADAIAPEHPDVSREALLGQIENNLASIYRMGLLKG